MIHARGIGKLRNALFSVIGALVGLCLLFGGIFLSLLPLATLNDYPFLTLGGIALFVGGCWFGYKAGFDAGRNKILEEQYYERTSKTKSKIDPQKAAEQGDIEAQFYLGEAYAEGAGVPQDSFLAIKWWLKAAEQGCGAAQHQLGVAYSNGDGVEKSLEQAYMWFSLAWDSPLTVGPTIFYNPSSEELRREIKMVMTPAQLATAKSLMKKKPKRKDL